MLRCCTVICAFAICVVSAQPVLRTSLLDRLKPPPNAGNVVDEVMKSIDRSSGPEVLIPLVIIPSLIGNVINAKLDKPSRDPWYCEQKSDWFQLWVPGDAEFVPPFRECWTSYMMPVFDNVTGLYNPPIGVQYQIPGYGDVSSVTYLDAKKAIGVWNDTVALLTKLGYTVGKDLVAAPYDWRDGPTAVVAQQFGPLKALIEHTYAANNNTPVALTSLSMGGLYTALFLSTYVDQAWKDEHISSFTSLSGALGGSVDSVMQLLSIDPSNEYGMPAQMMLELARSWGSVAWLLPTTAAYGDAPIVMTATRNYTAADMAQLLEDGGAAHEAMIINSTLPFTAPAAPGVPVNVVYGYNVPTLFSLAYNATSFPNTPCSYGVVDGDGTVPWQGLIALPKLWASSQSQAVTMHAIENMQHDNGVHDPRALQVLLHSLGFSSL